jgi:hypothetical protein
MGDSYLHPQWAPHRALSTAKARTRQAFPVILRTDKLAGSPLLKISEDLRPDCDHPDKQR